MSRPGGPHRAATTERPARRGAVRVPPVAGRADREEAATFPAGALAERVVHGVGARRAGSDWTARRIRGTTTGTGSVCRSSRRSRGPRMALRALTPHLSPPPTLPERPRRRPASRAAVDAAAPVDAKVRAHRSLQNRADAVSHSLHSLHCCCRYSPSEESNDGLEDRHASRFDQFHVTVDNRCGSGTFDAHRIGSAARGSPGRGPHAPASASASRTSRPCPGPPRRTSGSSGGGAAVRRRSHPRSLAFGLSGTPTCRLKLGSGAATSRPSRRRRLTLMNRPFALHPPSCRRASGAGGAGRLGRADRARVPDRAHPVATRLPFQSGGGIVGVALADLLNPGSPGGSAGQSDPACRRSPATPSPRRRRTSSRAPPRSSCSSQAAA